MSELTYANADDFESYDTRESALVEVMEMDEVEQLDDYPEPEDDD